MKQKLLSLRIIHLAIIASSIFALLVLFSFKQVNVDNYIISYIGLMLGVAIIPFSYMIPKILGKSAQDDPEIVNKFAQYQNSKIVQWVMIEGVIILNAVAFFLSGMGLSVGMGGILICYLAILFPKLEEFQRLFEIPDNIVQGTKYYLN